MRIIQSKLLFKIMFWLFVEIALTFVGLDDIADYSEFLSDLSKNCHHGLCLPSIVIALTVK